jgi:type I restriction enzyme R subunit
VLVAAGIGDDASFAEASERAGSFSRFVRSLVGLDRNAVKVRFADLLDEKRWTVHQIRWVNLVIDELSLNGVVELTLNGVVDAARVYESPYDSIAPAGPKTSSTTRPLTSSSLPSTTSPRRPADGDGTSVRCGHIAN